MNKPTTDPIQGGESLRTLLARVKELDEKATGGPWDVSQGWSPPHWEKDCHYNRIFAGEPNEISGIRKPVASTDGARDHSEASEVTFANAVLMAEYRSLAPQLARALEAVLEVCDHWDEWGGAVMSEAEELPEDMAVRMRVDAGRLINHAAVLRVAIAERLGGET